MNFGPFGTEIHFPNQMEVKWARGEINKHKGHGGLECDCCGHRKNGQRRRRRAPRYMLRALAQGKRVNYYPVHHSQPEDGEYIIGLSSWKKTLQRKPDENIWW